MSITLKEAISNIKNLQGNIGRIYNQKSDCVEIIYNTANKDNIYYMIEPKSDKGQSYDKKEVIKLLKQTLNEFDEAGDVLSEYKFLAENEITNRLVDAYFDLSAKEEKLENKMERLYKLEVPNFVNELEE